MPQFATTPMRDDLERRIELLEADNRIVGNGFHIFLLAVVTAVVISLLVGTFVFVRKVS